MLALCICMYVFYWWLWKNKNTMCQTFFSSIYTNQRTNNPGTYKGQAFTNMLKSRLMATKTMIGKILDDCCAAVGPTDTCILILYRTVIECASLNQGIWRGRDGLHNHHAVTDMGVLCVWAPESLRTVIVEGYVFVNIPPSVQVASCAVFEPVPVFELNGLLVK